MWSDTFMAIERAHLLRLGAWGMACVLAGTMLLAVSAVLARTRRERSPLLFHFALQTASWGLVELAFAARGLRGLALRDYAAATRFDRLLWLNLGLDVGYVAVGATLAITGWGLGRRLGPLGAGVAVAVQGAALIALDALVLVHVGSSV